MATTQPTNLLARYNNGEGSQLDSGTTETSAGPSAPLRGAGIIPTNNTFVDGTYNEFPEAASVIKAIFPLNLPVPTTSSW